MVTKKTIYKLLIFYARYGKIMKVKDQKSHSRSRKIQNKLQYLYINTIIMKNLDLTKLVKLKNPFAGEEGIIFKVTNYNEVTNRCVIQALNLSGWDKTILPTELVSADDIENIEELTQIRRCKFKGDLPEIGYIIVKENETHYEIVSEEKYNIFKQNEFLPEREFYSEWIEKGEVDIIE